MAKMFRSSRMICCSGLLLLSGLIGEGALRAAEDELSFKTTGGREFVKVVVLTVTNHKIEVMTSTGPETIQIADLPPELQKRFLNQSLKATQPKVGETLSFRSTRGRQFKGAIIRRITPEGLSLETSDGIEKIPYSDLPPELVTRFEGFDDVAAARFRAEEDAAQRALAARRAAQDAAIERAEAEKTAAEQTRQKEAEQNRRDAEPTNDQLGNRGTKMLGVPRLGGSGVDK